MPTKILEEQLGVLLRQRSLKLAVAESCTGGLLASRITDIPGSSDYFSGGIVAYSYEAKVVLLAVTWETLRVHGAVSHETVIEMARGARNRFEADIAVSVSGIAGPGGGLPEKPVGTTWIGLASEQGEWTRHFLFGGNRVENKRSAVDRAIQFVIELLNGRLVLK
jgi:PncC family amidohydrolase